MTGQQAAFLASQAKVSKMYRLGTRIIPARFGKLCFVYALFIACGKGRMECFGDENGLVYTDG